MIKKITKTLVPMVFTLLIGTSLTAQDCEAYFPMEEGALRVMENYNHKDKFQGRMTYEVAEISQEGDITKIHVNMMMEDKKEEEVYATDMVMECEEGVFRIDMKNYMQAGMMPEMGEMEVEVDSKNLEFPAELEPGMELPDGYITTSMSSGGFSMMSMKIEIVNRKVEGKETITTPAGTFECFKISQESKMKAMMKITTSSVEWIAKNVGVVRSESYDKKGNLESYSILTKFEK